jgi:hypothetical protein
VPRKRDHERGTKCRKVTGEHLELIVLSKAQATRSESQTLRAVHQLLELERASTEAENEVEAEVEAGGARKPQIHPVNPSERQESRVICRRILTNKGSLKENESSWTKFAQNPKSIQQRIAILVEERFSADEHDSLVSKKSQMSGGDLRPFLSA